MKTRKLFMVASIAAVAGVLMTTAVPGCSSSSDDTPEGTDASTNPDVKPIVPKETGPEEPEEAAPKTCPNLTALKEADFTTKWQPPPPVTSDCTQPDIDALKAAFKAATTGVKFTDMKTALGPTCAACVFSPLSTDAGLASTWSVYVETSAPGAAAVTAISNTSASCFARLKDNACGKARNLFEQCLRRACVMEDPAMPELGGCKSDSAVTTCYGAPAQGGPCKEITDAYVAACPDEADYIAGCNVYASITAGCAGGPEAGIDSSAP